VADCRICEKPSKGRRRRCPHPDCQTLVCPRCWGDETGECIECRDHDRPAKDSPPGTHLARIAKRRAVLDESIAMFEKATCAFWDGDYSADKLAEWGVSAHRGVSVSSAFDGYEMAVRQACADLGVPKGAVNPWPAIKFPGFCDDGSVDYVAANLEALG